MIQKRFPKWTLLLALGALALPAAHAEEETLNCESAQSTAEMNLCAQRDLEAADKELNELYQAIVQRLREDDETAALAALKVAQRAWVDFRKADVKAGILYLWPEGSGRTALEISIQKDLTKDRTAQLKRTYVDTNSGE